MMQGRFLDQQLLYGTQVQRFLRELLTSSGLFWLFNAVRKLGTEGPAAYLTSFPQWILLGAALVQAWVISRSLDRARWWHHFIAPLIYTAIDLLIEGSVEFFSAPYHLFYWLWAALMALAYLLADRRPMAGALGKSLLLVILLPASYFFAELDQGHLVLSIADLSAYWFGDPSHFFMLFGSLLLGMVLGLTGIMRDRFEALLYRIGSYFEQLASWSFDEGLIHRAYGSEKALDLHRVERTILFMDIRGFTPWSEAHRPHEVVEMVNRFYQAAEPIIKAHHGFKIQMTGDEVMTRFYTPDDAVSAALELRQVLARVLHPYQLGAGIGLHTGEVVEGLVGGEQTRQYGIFGDNVNIAARLQSQAATEEVVISRATWDRLAEKPPGLRLRHEKLHLKGKAEAIEAFVIDAVPG